MERLIAVTFMERLIAILNRCYIYRAIDRCYIYGAIDRCYIIMRTYFFALQATRLIPSTASRLLMSSAPEPKPVQQPRLHQRWQILNLACHISKSLIDRVRGSQNEVRFRGGPYDGCSTSCKIELHLPPRRLAANQCPRFRSSLPSLAWLLQLRRASLAWLQL